MSREAGPSIVEADFVLQALKAGVRLDGRSALQSRDVELIPYEDRVECALGDTRVVAQVSAEVVRPRPDRPFEGFLQVATEITPMASFAYDYGRSSEDEVLISRMLEKSIRRSRALDQEALCILAGQKVWSIRVDVHFLNDEGNLLDCASLAAIAALRHFRRPDHSVVGDEVTIHSFDDHVPVPLAMHHSPFCLSFCFFGPDSSLVVLDPSQLEERLASGTLTIAINGSREVCVFNKAGGAPLAADEVMKIVSVGVKRALELEELVKSVLERADERRKLQNAIQAR